MNLTISRPVQIFVLVAVIAVVGGGAMLAMKPKTAAAPPVVVTKPALPPASVVVASKAAGSRHTAAPAIASPSTAVTASAPTVTTPKTAPASVIGTNGLPLTINAAFRKHAIVIVSVFDPESPTDAISYAEAKAGATSAGVGFVGISLLDNPLAAALTSALPDGGLLPAPGVLIYRRPGTLVQRIDGFTDRDAVAEAAASSKTAAPMTGAGS